jgi:hypothetical protein
VAGARCRHSRHRGTTMNRLFAVAGLAVFLVACSDTTVPSSLRQAHVAVQDAGIPPPPPLSGDGGSGDLSVGFSDLVASAQPAIVCTHNFPLSFSWSYLEASGSTNQVVHLDLIGTPSGNIDLHDIQNGKIITHGTVSDAFFSFTIQDTDNLNLTSEGFSADVTGTLTDLTSGAKCQTSAHLDGTFEPSN